MINYSQLHNVCNMGIAKFRTLGDFKQCTLKSGYTFIDNNASVLAVAHLDTVQNSRKFSKNGMKVFSPRLDDRLGVYAILRLLPELGIKYDILLTEDEEIGMSTARYFMDNKNYNWMFQFDRAGSDVVMYQYETLDNIELLENSGFIVGNGSYSDICELDDLGCAGFNFGVGYHKPHSLDAYMVINQFETNIAKFANFYHNYHNLYIEYDDSYYHIPNEWYYLPSSYTYSISESDCPLCGLKTDETDLASLEKHNICLDCASWLKLD